MFVFALEQVMIVYFFKWEITDLKMMYFHYATYKQGMAYPAQFIVVVVTTPTSMLTQPKIKIKLGLT